MAGRTSHASSRIGPDSDLATTPVPHPLHVMTADPNPKITGDTVSWGCLGWSEARLSSVAVQPAASVAVFGAVQRLRPMATAERGGADATLVRV